MNVVDGYMISIVRIWYYFCLLHPTNAVESDKTFTQYDDAVGTFSVVQATETAKKTTFSLPLLRCHFDQLIVLSCYQILHGLK